MSVRECTTGADRRDPARVKVGVGVGGVCVFVFEAVSSELLDSSGGSKLPRPLVCRRGRWYGAESRRDGEMLAVSAG
jgi:hypothetical protein